MSKIQNKIVGLDFETYYDKDYTLRKLSTTEYIRHPYFEALMLGFRDEDMSAAEWAPKEDIAKVLARYDWDTCSALIHHAHFDGLILSHHYGVYPSYFYDTLSMARPLHGGAIRNNLETLSRYYGGQGKRPGVLEKLVKGLRRDQLTEEILNELGLYCAQDVDEMWRIFQAMRPSYPQKELDLIDLTVKLYTHPLLELDLTVAYDELEREKERRQVLTQRVMDYLGVEDPDEAKRYIRSRELFADLLRREGVQPPLKTSSRTEESTYAFAKSDLEFQALAEHPNPRVRLLVEAKGTLSSTIGESRPAQLIKHAHPALPVYLKYGAAHTLRWGGGDKVNLQNLPRSSKLRTALRAPESSTLIIADSAQIEARVVAWLAGEDQLLQSFRDGEDVYLRFAEVLYQRPLNKEVDKQERYVGKCCVLGLGYGMGAAKFQTAMATGAMGPALDLDYSACEYAVRTYRNAYPHITNLWRRFTDALVWMEHGITKDIGPVCTVKEGIALPNGMTLRYPNLHGVYDHYTDHYEQFTFGEHGTKIYGAKLTENVVQALARIIVADQILRVAEHFSPVLAVHDEGVFCVPTWCQKSALKFVLEEFHRSPEWAKDLPIAAEAFISPYYTKEKPTS